MDNPSRTGHPQIPPGPRHGRKRQGRWQWLATRTTELIVHHNDLDTTWEWHEADPDSILDAIEVCVRRLQINPDSPGLKIIAGEGEEWTVGDGSYRIEGYYDELLPFLARGQVEEGLQYEGVLPTLPPW